MIMLLLAAATLIFFFIIAAKRPLLALSALAALLPTYLLRFTVFGLPTTILEFIIWGVFLGWLIKLRITNYELRITKIQWPLALFFLASIISVFTAPNLYKAFGLWRAFFLEPAIIFLIILSAVKDKKDFEKIILGLSISALFVSAVALGQKFFGLPNPFLEDVSRASSVFLQPNMLGLYLGPIILLSIGQIFNFQFSIFNKFSIKKFLIILYWALVIILSFAAIVFAQSAGAGAAVIAGAVIFCLFQNKKVSAVSLSAIFIFLCFFILLFPKNIFVEKLFFSNWSGIVRVQIWHESWAMLKDNWLLGAGVGGYPVKILPYHSSHEWMDVLPMPHNIIFNFWSETGILGLAAFLWLLEKFARMCYTLLRKDRLIAATAISAMAAIIVHGLVDVPILKNDLFILFWIIYAMPFIIIKTEEYQSG